MRSDVKRRLWIASSACWIGCSLCSAQEPDKEAASPSVEVGFFADGERAIEAMRVPEPLPDDPAFDRYVPLEGLAVAADTLDASKLTDLAVGASEGERILLRQRRGLPTADLWSLAVETAVASSDVRSMERLANGAQRYGLADAAQRLDGALKLGRASRNAAEDVAIDPTEVDADEFAMLQAYSRSLEGASLRADEAYLADVRHNLERIASDASPTVREALRKMVERASTSEDKLPPEVAAQAQKLAAQSRFGNPFERLRNSVETEIGRATETVKEAGGRASNSVKTELNRAVSVTIEWSFDARVVDGYRLINFSIRDMAYDTTTNQLTFQVIGRIPFHARTQVKSPGEASFSPKIDFDVDYSMNASVGFDFYQGRMTAQPAVSNVDARVHNVRFNVELLDLVRHDIQRAIDKEVEKRKPTMAAQVSEAVSRSSMTYDGQQTLRQIADAIRSQGGGGGNVNVGSLIGTWQAADRTATFNDAVAYIQSQAGSSQFQYRYDATSGTLVGIDPSGQQTMTSVRWLSPNAFEWISPTGVRHYSRVAGPNVQHRLPARLDLRYLGAALGGAVEEGLKQQFAQYSLSDSGRSTWRPYDR